MERYLYRIKEWILRTFCRSEDGSVHEPESDIKDVVVPIADDEPLSGLDNAEQTEINEAPIETGTDKDIPLPEDINAEESNKVVFEDVEPISPVENTPLGIDAVNEQEAEDLKHDEAVSESKLVSLTVDSIKYYDKLRSQMPTDDLKTILDDVCRNMIENLIMAGCQPINEEPGRFDMSRHRVEPFQLVDEGTRYTKVLRKGIVYQNEVKLLAIVEL